ncbi:DUF551 domain-containing protein [Escherichia coli]
MTMTAEQLAQLRDHIDLRKAMPSFGPDTSIERLTILSATQCSFTTEIVEALLDELEAAEKRITELESLTAGMEQEPVAWKYRLVELATEVAGPWKMCLAPMEPGRGGAYRTEVITLYAAPQLPQPAPEALKRLRSIVADHKTLPRRKEWISGQQYSYVLLESIEAMVDDACRSAMLQGGNYPVTPDGWIPVSERMPEPYEYVLVTDGFDGCEVMRVNTDGYWGPAKSLYPGSITHWMPLPAAPQQEVK